MFKLLALCIYVLFSDLRDIKFGYSFSIDNVIAFGVKLKSLSGVSDSIIKNSFVFTFQEDISDMGFSPYLSGVVSNNVKTASSVNAVWRYKTGSLGGRYSGFKFWNTVRLGKNFKIHACPNIFSGGSTYVFNGDREGNSILGNFRFSIWENRRKLIDNTMGGVINSHPSPIIVQGNHSRLCGNSGLGKCIGSGTSGITSVSKSEKQKNSADQTKPDASPRGDSHSDLGIIVKDLQSFGFFKPRFFLGLILIFPYIIIGGNSFYTLTDRTSRNRLFHWGIFFGGIVVIMALITPY